MFRTTASSHGFTHGQTIVYAGRGLSPWNKPITAVFARSGRRIHIRPTDGHATVTFNNTEAFWAVSAIVDPRKMLNSMVVFYVVQSRRDRAFGTTEWLTRLAGMSDMLMEAARLIYRESDEALTERLADMIESATESLAP